MNRNINHKNITTRLLMIIMMPIILLRHIKLIIPFILMVLPSFIVLADQSPIDEFNRKTGEMTPEVYSVGHAVNELNTTTQEKMLSQLQESIILSSSNSIQNELFNIKRDDIIINKAQQAKANNINIAKDISDDYFNIYEGYSTLIEDDDGDGYYQTFSITFDADFITYNPYDKAIVYAELYLSENGGPWEHYYTTEDFIITGENTNDKFEVYSTLGEGFNSNHYDVLIDLYEVNSPIIMASYSSDNSNSLYALPLESSDYDALYYEEVYINGGSYSAHFLMLLLLSVLIRQLPWKKVKGA